MYLGRIVEQGTTEERADRAAPPVHARAALGRAGGRARRAADPQRRGPGPDADPGRLPLPPALPAGGVGRGRAAGDRGALPRRGPRARARPTRLPGPATPWPARRCRREDAALPLVHGPRRARARARAAVRARPGSYAGHLGLVAEPGSYFTCRAGDVPVVVVRDRDGELRAFVNVCRHRGAEVVSGAGRCTTLQCHYHAWTYGLDGALRAAPRAPARPRSRASSACGRPRVDTWGPFVFVNAVAGRRRRSRDTLGPMPDDRAPSGGLDVDALRFHHRVRVRARRQLEGRASRTTSSATTAPSPTRPSATSSTSTTDAYELETPPDLRQPLRARARAPRGAAYDAAGIDGQFHLVWPALKVNVMPGPPEPLDRPDDAGGPGRAPTASSTTSSPPARTPRWIADFIGPRRPGRRRGRACWSSRSSAGWRSGVLEHGELLLPSEELIAAFQEWVAGGLQSRGKPASRSASGPARRPRRRRGGGGRRTRVAVAVISLSVCTRVRQSPRPSAELHCTRTLADSGSPSTMR